MTSRPAIGLVIGAAIVALVSALPWTIESLSPPAGLVRSVFPQLAFGGAPVVAVTSEINLRFLDDEPPLPRQNFSSRWRGFFFVSQSQTVEFFAGGNDEVELRIDGALILRRNLNEGMRTIGRRLRLDAGSHEIAVDYQQFGGSMALNIQRALEGGRPQPFSPAELFSERVDSRQVRLLDAARWMRRITPYAWAVFAVLLIGTAGVLNFARWRRTAAPQSTREYAARLSVFAAPALLVPAVVFALGPHTIYAANTAEFAVSYGELAAPWLLRTVVLNWMVLLLVGCILALVSEKAARMYGAMLLATGLLLWGQGNLWNADYGVLTGQDLDLGSHAWRAPYELAGWTAALILALVYFRRISRIAALAALAFMGVQTAAVLLAATDSGALQRVRWLEPPANLYQFSATRNVIHIVLDEFQSDVFHDILQQDRSALDEQFSGFQYFADHAGSFPTTSFSMPAMLTGLEYRNEKPAPDFIREAFKQSSVFEEVSKAGYDVDAASIVPVDAFEQWLGPDSEPNWKGARFQIRKPYVSRRDYREVTARQLLELSLFRHVPHAGKVLGTEQPARFYRPIWMDRTETPAQVRRHEASNSAAFLERFIDSMTSGRDRPVYKLLHVGVPHRPVVVDRNCRFIGLTDMSRQSYTEQCRCAIRLVATLLDRARALRIYDSSLIIISSDHGTDLEPVGYGGTSESLSPIPGPSTVRLPAIASTAKTVMLIKPPDRNGPLTISEAPTSHVDLPSTILDLLGLPGGVQDRLMFRRDPQQRRTRFFGMYNPHVRFPNGFLDRLDVLTLDGRVLDASAWNVRQLIWRPDLRLDSRNVDVGPRSGNYYLGPGWSLGREETAATAQRITFVQALTSRAIISASLPTSAVKLVLRASWPRMEGPRSIRVASDGRPAGLLNPSGQDGYHDVVISVPPDPSRPAISEIALHFESGGKRDFVFKLDRLIIESRP
jgi:hypothetical protein